MHLASINTADQQKDLEEHIESFGKQYKDDIWARRRDITISDPTIEEGLN